MYAIIATGGKQYKVAEGDIIKVEKLGVEAGQSYTFDQVLAVSGDELKVGTPVVEGATVEASVIGDGKAKKVIVYTPAGVSTFAISFSCTTVDRYPLWQWYRSKPTR